MRQGKPSNWQLRFAAWPRLLIGLLIGLFVGVGQAHAFCAGAMLREIQAIAALKDVIDAVKAGNSKRMSKTAILELDARWIKTQGKLQEAQEILESRISVLLAMEMKRKSTSKK